MACQMSFAVAFGLTHALPRQAGSFTCAAPPMVRRYLLMPLA